MESRGDEPSPRSFQYIWNEDDRHIPGPRKVNELYSGWNYEKVFLEVRAAVAVCRTVYRFFKCGSLGQELASRKPQRDDLCFQRFGHFLRNIEAGRKGFVSSIRRIGNIC
jgi:hypothetical protein